MKKFFQSKGFIVSALAVLCVAILGVCWFVSRDRTDEFRSHHSRRRCSRSGKGRGRVPTGGGGGGGSAHAPSQASDATAAHPQLTCRCWNRWRGRQPGG